MIKCYLFGGLGNQIFQFLAGLRLSYLSKKKIIFDYSFIDAFKSNHEVKIYELFDLKKNIKFDNTNIIIKKFLFIKILIFLFNLSRKLNLCKQIISESNFVKPLENKVKYFVNISTDKAANPINILGRTKRVAEMQCLNSIKKNNTKICCVRFGNVYETNGSLTQLVTEKIYNNQKISISSPPAERYFMNKSEAAYLLLNSLIFLKNDNDIFNRKIYVSNMGLSININDLVRKIIFLNGRNIDDFISKKFYGLNKGEKIKEDLFNKTEIVTRKLSNKILEIKYIYDKNFQLN